MKCEGSLTKSQARLGHVSEDGGALLRPEGGLETTRLTVQGRGGWFRAGSYGIVNAEDSRKRERHVQRGLLGWGRDIVGHRRTPVMPLERGWRVAAGSY